jgi:hypothetical protein
LDLSPIDFPPDSISTQPFSQSKTVQAVSQPSTVSSPEPVLEQVENKEEVIENPPEDWLQPKVYKGTSES